MIEEFKPASREDRVGRASVMPAFLACDDAPTLERAQQAGHSRGGEAEALGEINPTQPMPWRFGQATQRRKIGQAETVEAADFGVRASFPQGERPPNCQEVFESRHDGMLLPYT